MGGTSNDRAAALSPVSPRQALSSHSILRSPQGYPQVRNEEEPRFDWSTKWPACLSGGWRGANPFRRTQPWNHSQVDSVTPETLLRSAGGACGGGIVGHLARGAGGKTASVCSQRNVPVGGACSRPGGRERGPGGGRFLVRTASGGCERRRQRSPKLGGSPSAAPGPGRCFPPQPPPPPPPPQTPPRRAQRNVRPSARPGPARSRGAGGECGAGPAPCSGRRDPQQWGPSGTRPGALALSGLGQQAGPGGPALGRWIRPGKLQWPEAWRRS